MSISRWTACSLTIVFAFAVFWTCLRQADAETPDQPLADAADASASGAASGDPFAVPEGSPGELLEFIERLANPQQEFKSQRELQRYLEQVSTAIAAAADKIVAAEATDRQTIDAIEWKIEALRLRAQLGDKDVLEQTDDFLASLDVEGRPAVAEVVEQLRKQQAQARIQQAQARLQQQVMMKLREWPRFSADQKSEFVDWFVELIKADGIGAGDVQLVVRVGDMLADTPDSELALRTINELLPLFRASDDESVARGLPLIEGIARRLDLPGNKLELEGKFLDGSPLDWEAYRGKVVLVDFWATECGPCLAEIPNVLDNYRKYQDKGFDVLGISLDEDRSAVEQVVQEIGIPWKTLFHGGSSGWQHPMAEKYGIMGIPTVILVDQQGHVVHMSARGPKLGEELQRLLGEPAVDATSANDSGNEQKTAQSSGR